VPADRLAVADLEHAAEQVHVGLDEVDVGGERGAQVGQRVAGPVRHGKQAHDRRVAADECPTADGWATSG
jgi:hypothetical protein